MDQADIRASFLRQRRNLMTISVVNLFVSLVGIKLEKLNVFGNEFAVQSPHYIVGGLWVAFFYWLVRYFQALHDSGNLGILDKYKSMVFLPTVLLIRPQFEEYVKAEMRSVGEPESTEHYVTRIDWKQPPSMWSPFAKRRLVCEAKYYHQDSAGGMTEKNVLKEWELSPHHATFGKSWFAGLWYVLAKSSFGTEYVLPPLFAFGVLITCLIRAAIR